MSSPLRSLTRYVSAALGPGVEVRMTGQDGSWERPFCAVLEATPLASSPHGSAYADCRQGYAIAAYTAQGINAESSRIEAGRVRDQLWQAFNAGVDPVLFRGQRRHPLRIPRFDYRGVPLFQGVGEERRAGTMRVLDASFSVFADTGGDTFTVAGDVRLGWVEAIAIPSTEPLTATVTATFEG